MCGEKTFYLHVLDKKYLVIQEVGVFDNPDADITIKSFSRVVFKYPQSFFKNIG